MTEETKDGATPEPAAGTTAVAEYNATAAALADLEHRFHNVVWDVTTTKGIGEARKARRELIDLRVNLEQKRVQLKAPHLEAGKLIDDEAKRLTGSIRALETPIDEQIKVEEERKETERKRLAEEQRLRDVAERERISRMVLLVNGYRQRPLALIGKSVSQIQTAIVELQSVDVEAVVDPDYRVEAQAALDLSVETLTMMRTDRQKIDEDAKKAREEKAEADRLRIAAEAVTAAALALREKEEAERRIAMNDEAMRLASERRAVRDEAVAAGSPWYPVGDEDPPVKEDPAPAPHVEPASVDTVGDDEREPEADRPEPTDAAHYGMKLVGEIVGELEVGFQSLPLILWVGEKPPLGTRLYVPEDDQLRMP